MITVRAEQKNDVVLIVVLPIIYDTKKGIDIANIDNSRNDLIIFFVFGNSTYHKKCCLFLLLIEIIRFLTVDDSVKINLRRWFYIYLAPNDKQHSG